MNLILYVWEEPRENMKLKGSWAVEGYMPS